MSYVVAANNDLVQEPRWRDMLEASGGVPRVVAIAQSASRIILDLYHRKGLSHRMKGDGSPVSEADEASAAHISEQLSVFGVPVVCEEGPLPEIESHPVYWLVDPLDGTREFLARNGEFSVNIALVCRGEPVVGVLAIPVTGEVYFGIRGGGAFRLFQNETTRIFNQRTTTEYVAATSRSFACPETDEWLRTFGSCKRVRCGSAIKFCRLAEGTADIYLRLGRTMEWDTAAGQVLLEESGCRVVSFPSGERLRYGKPDFVNPDFLAARRGIEIPVFDQSDPASAAG